MENASKALIMAGSVLIALMIIGALVLMFSNLTSYQETNTRSTRSSQISEFNNQFETYNRTNVRGSDLYSLLNNAIDYNRRQSIEGTNWADQGQELAYEPMTITFTITRSELTADGGAPRLFTGNSDTYTVSGSSNVFESSIKTTIDNLENTYGQDSLTNLTTNITNVFIDNGTAQEKLEAIQNFNSASRVIKIDINGLRADSVTETQIRNAWNTLQSYKDDVYKYYEYVQFKRARFNCTDVKYNQNTGRVVSMTFEFTNRFN